jgi:hypothetical protein
MKKYLLSLFAFCVGIVCTHAQDFVQLKQNLDWQVYNYPQEKIHVMTDKPYYITGDTVWLRAFVVNAVNHQPVDASKFVYVELISPMDEVTMRVKLKERDGVFKGFLPLDPTKVAEGEYTLTAYTYFMQNQGEQYFFKKKVKIVSSFSINSKIDYEFEWKNQGKDNESLKVNFQYLDAQTGEKREYSSFKCFFPGDRKIEWLGGKNNLSVEVKNKELPDGCFKVQYGNHAKYITFPPSSTTTYDVTFYPEGGYLVPCHENHITFKSMDSNGKSIDVTGSIVDTGGNAVAQIKTVHDGMGLATFNPLAGMTYKAHCSNDELGEKIFELPQVRSDATVLQATHEGKTIKITAHGSQENSALIAVQQRGRLLATGFGNVAIDTDTLPAGVVQAILMNENGRMLSERLFFVTGKQVPSARLSSDRNEYDSRELVETSVDLSEFDDNITGNFAVSVTDDRNIKADSTTSILTDLLLQSDLQGRINNPAWYFESGERSSQLDILMMTQGWRRYDVPHALVGRFIEPQYPIEQGQMLSGIVKSEWRNKPMENAIVKIMAPKIGFGNLTTTDVNGRWMIDNVTFPDSTLFVMQATNQKDKGQSNLFLDQEKQVAIQSLKPSLSFSSKLLDDDLAVTFLKNEKQRLQYIDGVANVMLDEIVVEKKKRRKIESVYDLLSSRAYDYKYFDKWDITSWDSAIRRFMGISIKKNGLFYRGELVGIFVDGAPVTGWDGPDSGHFSFAPTSKTNTSSSTPQIMRSASDDAYNHLQMMYPFTWVRQISFIPPGSSAGFSSYAGGILRITLKNGTEEGSSKRNYTIKKFSPLGFQRAAEFYAPRYDTGNNGIGEGTDLRETLYWNPSIAIISNKQARFNFYTNDAASTSYTITIEGVTANGELIHAVKKISKK